MDYKTHIILEFGNPFVHVRPPIKDTSAQHDGWRTEEHLELGHFSCIILACSKVAHCSAKNESDKKIFKQIDNFALGLIKVVINGWCAMYSVFAKMTSK